MGNTGHKSRLPKPQSLIFVSNSSLEKESTLFPGQLPANPSDLQLKVHEDSQSEHGSSFQSSDLSDCFKNTNCWLNLSSKLSQEVEKESSALQKEALDSIINGILNENEEYCEVPSDYSYSDF